MPFDLAITDEVESGIDPEFLRRVVAIALGVGGGSQSEVSLLLADDAAIARVHGTYLGDPSPTDVISFELDSDTIDIVVSVECARREASQMGHAAAAEVALYVAHGVLHACGFDDHEPLDRARMRDAEHEVMSQLGVSVSRVDARDVEESDS